MTTDRKPGKLAAFAAAFALLLGAAAPALAVCGDAEVDPGELCDDGNLADGDCCTSTCQKPTGCVGTYRAALLIKDLGDDRDDKLFWRYFRGATTFEDWGDPTDETGYSFCIWDDDELKVQAFVEPGGFCHPRRPCWKIEGRGDPQAYHYFNKATNETGIDRLHLGTQQPSGVAYISLRALDVNLTLPGPVAYDQYFNQTSSVTVQFTRHDSPVCWESVFIRNHKNIWRRFKALLRAQVDG